MNAETAEPAENFSCFRMRICGSAGSALIVVAAWEHQQQSRGVADSRGIESARPLAARDRRERVLRRPARQLAAQPLFEPRRRHPRTSRHDRHRRAAALRRGVDADGDRAHDFGGDERVAGIVRMQSVRRVVATPDSCARRTSDRRRRHSATVSALTTVRVIADGDALRRLPLRQRGAGEIRQPRRVRHVQHDDARRARRAS